MIKKIVFFLFCMCLSFNVEAKKGINIFAYSRAVPQTPIYNQYGQKSTLADYKGQVVLANFWSRYCVPCIKELDNLNEFAKRTKDDGIKVVIISPAEEWVSDNEQKELLIKYGAPDLDYYVDKNGKLAGDFGIFASPHTVLINKSAEEFGRISGSVEWDDDDVIEYIYKLKAEYGYPKNDK